MRSLLRVASKPGAAGAPLPPVFTRFEEFGIKPRRGQVTMIVAPPNGGKSFLALYWVVRLVEREGMTGLYFSADTDDFTMKLRATAILTGEHMADIETDLLRGRGRKYHDVLAKLTPLRFDFEPDPTYQHMAEEIQAFEEAWGDYPQIIVVDNLMNVVSTNENEWSGMKEVTKALHRIARQTGAAVFVLHHMNESDVKDPRFPAPRKAVAGKVNQLPEVILSLGFDSTYGRLRVAKVKDRNGRHDPTGTDYVEVFVDVAHGAIYENKWARDEGRAA